MTKLPVIFFGHGSPMLALEKSETTEGLKAIGEEILKKYQSPKAILMISAHWYAKDTFIQTTTSPTQIYDMYGFPDELYQFKYPVQGYQELSKRVKELLGDSVSANDEWGIDHGAWTVLTHVFPDADIPVVQLSINKNLTTDEMFKIGQKLSPLREEGILIMASGNIVHNLLRTDWRNPHGTKTSEEFNKNIVSLVENKDFEKLIHYKDLDHWLYAIPTPDHYLPLLYILGAAGDDTVQVFNNFCNLGTMAMTGFAFGL